MYVRECEFMCSLVSETCSLAQVQGYSPLGSGDFKKPSEPTVLASPVLTAIGQKYGKV